MRLNKRILIACILILLFVSALFTTDIFSQGKRYTAKELGRLSRKAAEAAGAYYTVKSIIDDLTEDLKELQAKYDVAKKKFTLNWNIFELYKGKYDAAKDDMWIANEAYKEADNRRISAQGDVNSAEARISYCQNRLDEIDSYKLAKYWKDELKKAQDALSEAESKRDEAIKDKNQANSDYKKARSRMKKSKNHMDYWEDMTDRAKKKRDDAKTKRDDMVDKIDGKMGEYAASEAAHMKADAAYKAYKAAYKKQQQGEI